MDATPFVLRKRLLYQGYTASGVPGEICICSWVNIQVTMRDMLKNCLHIRFPTLSSALLTALTLSSDRHLVSKQVMLIRHIHKKVSIIIVNHVSEYIIVMPLPAVLTKA